MGYANCELKDDLKLHLLYSTRDVPFEKIPFLRDKLSVCLPAHQVVARNREFWKFLAVCVVTVNLKSIFRHLDATLPKYQIR